MNVLRLFNMAVGFYCLIKSAQLFAITSRGERDRWIAIGGAVFGFVMIAGFGVLSVLHQGDSLDACK